MKKTRDDVHAGQIWKDRDKRMLSGNRCVRVLYTAQDGQHVVVKYRASLPSGEVVGPVLTSKRARFQRAFDLVSPATPEEPA